MDKCGVLILLIGVIYGIWMTYKTSSRYHVYEHSDRISILQSLEKQSCLYMSPLNHTEYAKCLDFYRNIKPSRDNCQVIVYGQAAEEIRVNSLQCEEFLLPDIDTVTARSLNYISTFEEFQSVLLHSSTYDGNEHITVDKKVLNELIEKIILCDKEYKAKKQSISVEKVNKELGGSGVIFANRMAHDGCEVEFNGRFPQKYTDLLYPGVITNNVVSDTDSYINFPLYEGDYLKRKYKVKKSKLLTVSSTTVLQYKNIKSDQNKMTILPSLTELDKKVSNYTEFYSELAETLKGSTHISITEMTSKSHFSNITVFLNHVTSIYTNSPVLDHMVHYLNTSNIVFSYRDQTLSLILKNLEYFLNAYKKLTRIQVTDKDLQLICSKIDTWTSPFYAAMHSSLTQTQLQCDSNFLQGELLIHQEVLDPEKPYCMKDVMLGNEQEVYYAEGFQCCVSPVLECAQIKNVLYFPETLAAKGLAYQRLRH